MNPDAGGIFITGGQNNIIQNNEINNNGPQGIIIENSPGNLIGGPIGVEGNQIIDTSGFVVDLTTQNGIILRGSGTTQNVIQNNFIGTDAAENNFGLTPGSTRTQPCRGSRVLVPLDRHGGEPGWIRGDRYRQRATVALHLPPQLRWRIGPC